MTLELKWKVYTLYLIQEIYKMEGDTYEIKILDAGDVAPKGRVYY